MTDPFEHLRDALSEFEVDDRWQAAQARAAEPAGASLEATRPARGGERVAWWLAAAAALIALVTGIAVVTQRGSDGDSIAPVETGSTTQPTPAPTTALVTPTTVPDTTPTTPTTAPTSAPSTIPAEPATIWTRECTDRLGAATEEPADPLADRTFGPLAPEPGIEVIYPLTAPAPSVSDAVSSIERVPGGTFISLLGTGVEFDPERIVAVVDDSGAVRWRRCFTGITGWAAVVDADRGVIDVQVHPDPAAEAVWWAFDLLTGESEPETERTAEELERVRVPGESEIGFDLAATPDLARLRRLNADGSVQWRRDDLFAGFDEGFRAVSTTTSGGDIAFVRACVGEPIDPASSNAYPDLCPFALLGIDVDTGATRWQRDGAYAVSLVADGYAIVTTVPTDDNRYELLDLATGEVVPDGVSSEPGAFLSECCGGYDYNRVEATGAVAWSVATDVLRIWFPADVGGPGTTVDLLGPSTEPVVTARLTGMTSDPPECASLPCWTLHALGTGFPPGTTVTAECWIGDGGAWSPAGDPVAVPTSADGSLIADVACHVAQRGGTAKVTIDGVESPTLTT